MVRSLFNSGVTSSVELSQNRIDSFAITADHKTHHFEYLYPEIHPENVALNGYYEIIYRNKLQIVYKQSSRTIIDEALTLYIPDIHKYIIIDNKFYKINSKQKLLKLFPEKKKMIKKKIFSYQLNYKNLSTSNLIEIVKYIESL
ncbi:hypothetical protein [Marinifilum flexuosum]|uniref:hypothetical protein n=1 Tax=Marinifilum flexuosum TaxID=1117708 RepID=UPI0024941CA0|nr:hypothetical protein [Marinifilum flexuosum]